MNIRTTSMRVAKALACTWALALACAAGAQDFPDKRVTIVVGFTAGGTTDLIARAVAQGLTDKWKQPVIIDNKPGAGGNIGNEAVVRARADGTMLALTGIGSITINPYLYKTMSFNPLTELEPVIKISDSPNVVVVGPSVKANTLEELVAYGKANPGKLSYASTGVGTLSHLFGHLLMQRAGVQAVHIPYKGADALKDLMGGQVDVMLATLPSVLSQIQSGKLRALAVSTAKRAPLLPNVPTVVERGYPGVEAGAWLGVFAPKGTPKAVIDKINRDINVVMRDKSIADRMAAEGTLLEGGSAADFAAFVQREAAKWKTVVIETNAKVE